jgi:two-component system, chemotaxis family, protein-glutamate methylesterase/glutaminase
LNGKKTQKKIRALVIDDSAYNRQAIAEMLESHNEIEVVGRAANGEEGLKEALKLKPDVITLDLEMPKMDGFTFLRILMSRQATPIIVISSYSRKQNVFKALELGALDFIAKPTRYLSPELHKIRDELLDKIMMVRSLRTGGLQIRAVEHYGEQAEAGRLAPLAEELPGLALVVVGASTGGPPALQHLLQKLPDNLPAAYLVAQHMPENFTRAFADRLNRYSGLTVSEAKGGEPLEPGKVLVAPGGKNLTVVRRGAALHAEVSEASDSAKYVPSIDLLFQSAAGAMGNRVVGILLTGMGADGRDGIRAVKDAGGRTVAESEETAVIFGMPKEAIDSGRVDKVLRLDEIAEEVSRMVKKICGMPE